MNQYHFIGQLFEKEPVQWGLRGDPYLWRKMRDYFSQAPLPLDAVELEETIAKVFLKLTGHLISDTENFYLEAFAHGGMSSGGICLEFWRNSAIPLLRNRYEMA